MDVTGEATASSWVDRNQSMKLVDPNEVRGVNPAWGGEMMNGT